MSISSRSYLENQICLNIGAGSTNLKTVIYLWEYNGVDLSNMTMEDLNEGLVNFSVANSTSLELSSTGEQALITLVREPLVRFVANYREKFERFFSRHVNIHFKRHNSALHEQSRTMPFCLSSCSSQSIQTHHFLKTPRNFSIEAMSSAWC